MAQRSSNRNRPFTVEYSYTMRGEIVVHAHSKEAAEDYINNTSLDNLAGASARADWHVEAREGK